MEIRYINMKTRGELRFTGSNARGWAVWSGPYSEDCGGKSPSQWIRDCTADPREWDRVSPE